MPLEPESSGVVHLTRDESEVSSVAVDYVISTTSPRRRRPFAAGPGRVFRSPLTALALLGVWAAVAASGEELTITSASPLPGGEVGAPYSYTLEASGGVPPYTWNLVSGSPGPGLSVSASGVVSGTPTASGTNSFTVRVADSAAASVAKEFTLKIALQSLSITTEPPLPEGATGKDYSKLMSAAGGTPPYSWSLGDGGLPDGVQLRSSGNLDGRPREIGAFDFKAKVKDSAGVTAYRSYTLSVVPGPLVIETKSPLERGEVGKPYFENFTAHGGVLPYKWSLDVEFGPLPAGLTLSEDGTLGGTPETFGTTEVKIRVTDSQNVVTAKQYSLTIRPPASYGLIVSETRLNFKAAAGGEPPAPQLMSVSTRDRPTGYTVQEPSHAWVSVSPLTGTTPAILVVRVDQNGLAPGRYRATIRITSSVTGEMRGVGVDLTVEAVAPDLRVSPGLVDLSSNPSETGLVERAIFAQTIGAEPLAVTAAVTSPTPWLAVSPAQTTAQPRTETVFTVQVDQSMLGMGYHRGVIELAWLDKKLEVPVTVSRTDKPFVRLDPAGFYFEAVQGAAISSMVPTLSIVTDSEAELPWNAETVGADGWLSIPTASGVASKSARGQAAFTVNAEGLGPGNYYGRIRVSADAFNAPVDALIVLRVLSPLAEPVPVAWPAGLLFAAARGGPPPDPQSVTLTTNGNSRERFRVSVSTADNRAWLTASPAEGYISHANPAQLNIGARTYGLASGIYRGSVYITTGGEIVRAINVTLVVQGAATKTAAAKGATVPLRREASDCAPSRLAPADVGMMSNFSSPVGWPTPLRVQVADNCGNAVSQGQVTASFSNGDPAVVAKLLDTSRGLYSATWAPNKAASTVTITIRASAAGLEPGLTETFGSVTANVAPTLSRNGTLHNLKPEIGASLAPGTIVQIHGTGMAGGEFAAEQVPLLTELHGTSVIVGGIEAPLYFVSPTQLNALLPFELAPGRQYQVLVNANGELTLPDTLQLAPVQPGVMASPDGLIAAYHGDGTLVNDSSPAAPGENLVIYLAGMGLTDIPVASGHPSPGDPPARVTEPPEITVGGQPASVDFAGLAPGLVGLYQVNFQVPAGLASGKHAVVIEQAQVPANETVIPVQ